MSLAEGRGGLRERGEEWEAKKELIVRMEGYHHHLLLSFIVQTNSTTMVASDEVLLYHHSFQRRKSIRQGFIGVIFFKSGSFTGFLA